MSVMTMCPKLVCLHKQLETVVSASPVFVCGYEGLRISSHFRCYLLQIWVCPVNRSYVLTFQELTTLTFNSPFSSLCGYDAGKNDTNRLMDKVGMIDKTAADTRTSTTHEIWSNNQNFQKRNKTKSSLVNHVSARRRLVRTHMFSCSLLLCNMHGLYSPGKHYHSMDLL